MLYTRIACNQTAAHLMHALQTSGAIAAALDQLRSAGAELIPFDSSEFDRLAEAAWPAPSSGGLDGASAFESTVTLARQACILHHFLLIPWKATSRVFWSAC